MELQIYHTGNQNGSAMFEVIRSIDMKRTVAVALPDPAKFPVKGHPAKQFLPELRWYLEDYLQIPLWRISSIGRVRCKDYAGMGRFDF